jgi:hypothetical protein
LQLYRSKTITKNKFNTIMTPSYITSSYGKIGGKKSKSSLALDAASPTSVREPSYREQGAVRQPISRNPMGGGTSTGGNESGSGRIEGPSITLGEDSDPFEKFLKEQRDIKNMQEMQNVRAWDKAIRDPNYLRKYESNLRKEPFQNEGTIRENLKNAASWADARKKAQDELRGRQGHSSPNDTRNRYQS